MLAPWKKSYDQPRQHIKKQRHYFANKGSFSQSYGFSSSHVWMWELDHKESWVPKNWCFWTVVLEKTLENPLDCKEIKPINPKGNQSWIFTGRTDAEAEAPIIWPPDEKSQLIRKDSDAGKDWRQEEKGTTEDETVGWYHRLNGYEFEQAPEIRDGQGGLACCSPWGRKESDVTEWLKWSELNWTMPLCPKVRGFLEPGLSVLKTGTIGYPNFNNRVYPKFIKPLPYPLFLLRVRVWEKTNKSYIPTKYLIFLLSVFTTVLTHEILQLHQSRFQHGIKLTLAGQ